MLNCSSVPLRLCPVAPCPDDFMIAGCEGGCCCWDVRLDQPKKQRVCEVELIFSEDSKMSGQRVDGLAFVSDDVVASKGSGQGVIYLWSWSQTWAGRDSRSVLPVVILARLQWSPTNLAYFSLSTCPATPQAPTQILKWPQPVAQGQPVTKTMVNTVVANAAFTYLTALTDSNIVSIWRSC
ncbi:Leucine-rich repeat and WD repeat-containing protein 1 [Cricetulus griseus]|uniref:Leucine-rich repeat and WD repeat-containing protein 1 n=1 Tax=Cricetulus griseus TaxID=10029 RepID=G3HA31_CRIGR|nr:Leucine-rich repeat and WD repeat-containing protein 1 [Cricetulus griseus]